MERKKAISHLKKVIERLHSVNGIFATPLHSEPFVKVRYAWVFGSLAKGSLEPNDVDIFIELVEPEIRSKYDRNLDVDGTKYDDLGRKVKRYRMRDGEIHKLQKGFLLDVPLLKDTGLCYPKDAHECLLSWLKKRMPKVSLHVVGNDDVFNELDVKYLIYPRCDFDMSE